MDGKIETVGNTTDNGNEKTDWEDVAAMADEFREAKQPKSATRQKF